MCSLLLPARATQGPMGERYFIKQVHVFSCFDLCLQLFGGGEIHGLESTRERFTS